MSWPHTLWREPSIQTEEAAIDDFCLCVHSKSSEKLWEVKSLVTSSRGEDSLWAWELFSFDLGSDSVAGGEVLVPSTPWCSSCHGAQPLLHEWDCLHHLYFHLNMERPLRGLAWSTQLKECYGHWLGVGGHQVCPLLSLNFGYFPRHFKWIIFLFSITFSLVFVPSHMAISLVPTCQNSWQFIFVFTFHTFKEKGEDLFLVSKAKPWN